MGTLVLYSSSIFVIIWFHAIEVIRFDKFILSVIRRQPPNKRQHHDIPTKPPPKKEQQRARQLTTPPKFTTRSGPWKRVSFWGRPFKSTSQKRMPFFPLVTAHPGVVRKGCRTVRIFQGCWGYHWIDFLVWGRVNFQRHGNPSSDSFWFPTTNRGVLNFPCPLAPTCVSDVFLFFPLLVLKESSPT